MEHRPLEAGERTGVGGVLQIGALKAGVGVFVAICAWPVFCICLKMRHLPGSYNPLRQDRESFDSDHDTPFGAVWPENAATQNTHGAAAPGWNGVDGPAGDNMLSMPVQTTGQANSPGVYTLNSDHHRSLIRESHQRSNAFGLQSAWRPDYAAVQAADLDGARDENRLLYQHASPVMETLYEQIANTHSMVLLTSRNGLILHSLGDADFLEKASQVALMPGVEWSEQSKGTNAIGTALAEERPVVVHGNDHFLQANQFLTCSCTPIFDPYGKVMGALDVTGISAATTSTPWHWCACRRK